MNFTWLRHLGFSLITTAVCLSACLVAIYALGLKFPFGLGEALTLVGIGFAALISVFIFLPKNLWGEMATTKGLNRAFWFWLPCSMVIAAAGSLGGGIIRRLILGQPTVLGEPSSPWWYAVCWGWGVAFAMCLIGVNLYKRSHAVGKAMDEVDAWVMGAFAAAGGLAALPWQPFGDFSDNPLIKLALVALFAGLTGAGGGLVARLFSLVTFNFAPKKIWLHISEWFLKLYLSLAMAAGITSVAILVFAQALLSPRHIEAAEFFERSVDGRLLYDSQSYLNGTLARVSVDFLLYTDLGNQLVLLFVAGSATCYVFRIAAPYFAVEEIRWKANVN
jgi:uncharacterized membrane protein YeiH